MVNISDIIVVGAGASYGARPELPPAARPPLGRDLPRYLQKWRDHNHSRWLSSKVPRLQTVSDFRQVRTVGRTEYETFDAFLRYALRPEWEDRGFEKAMESWLEDSEEAAFSLPTINRILAASLLTGQYCTCDERPDLYDRLLRGYCMLPGCAASVALISLNYEMLCEEAIARVMTGTTITEAVHYIGTSAAAAAESGPEQVTVFKPHGSANWMDYWGTPGSQTNPDRPPSRLSASGLGFDHGRVYVFQGGRTSVVGQLEADAAPLVMAQYSRGKPVAANSSVIETVRTRCIEFVERATTARITVIGVLPPRDQHDDPFLHRLFGAIGNHRGQRLYVNPSRRDCENARALGLEPVMLDFEAFLRHAGA